MQIRIPFTRATLEFADKTKPSGSSMMNEVGVAGEVVFTGFKDEEARTDKVTIDKYREMLDKDPTVESLFNIFTLPIVAATHRIDADDQDTGETQAEFIRRNLLSPPHKGGMELPFSLFLDQLLLSVVDGFQLWERVYRIDQDGRYALKKLAHRDSIGLTLKRDENGGYGGAIQRVNYNGEWKEIELEAYKTFLFTHNKARSFLYGRSAFRSLYSKYDKKRRLEYLDSISLQNDAIKAKLLKRTVAGDLGKNGKTARNAALAALAKLGEVKPVASVPYGYEVDVLSAEGRSPHESIERQNSEMARAFLASVILLGSQGGSNVGSYALSDKLSELLMVSLKSFMTKVEEHVNQYLIADLIDLNFAERHYPEFHFDDLTSDVVEVITSAFTELLKQDRISDEMVEGIEEAAANRLEIDLDRIKKDRKKRADKEAKEVEKKAAARDDDKNDPGGSGADLSDVNSRDFPGLYDGLVDEGKLGCIMLDVQTFDVRTHVEGADADLYVTDEAHSGGAVAETESHITLLHGLLQNGNIIKDKVDAVLKGWKLESVVIDDVTSFEVPADSPSVPIVARVWSSRLDEAHDRLALLPHINTFGNYQPHITLAYVKNDPDTVQKWVKSLGNALRGMRLSVTGINYGDLPEDEDKGGASGDAGKFLSDVHWHRDLTEAEKTVKFAEINERIETLESQFMESMKPITEKVTDDLIAIALAAKSPLDVKVELPADYGKTVLATIKTAFNYGKITAADEDSVAAPATTVDHTTKMREQADFVVEKQQDDLKNLIRSELLTAQRTNQLAEGEEDQRAAEVEFKASLAATLAKWFADKLKLTAGAIVPQGINDGRGATFDATAQDDDLYQWSAILDGKCTIGICPPLDGKVIDRIEYMFTRWKPKLHWNCRCLLVRIRRLPGARGDVAIPQVTGFPLTSAGYNGPLI